MSAPIAVTLQIPIEDTWRAGTRIQVYTDWGSGEIDTDRPLLARPVEVFPGQAAQRGVGDDAADLVGTAGGPRQPATNTLASEICGVTPLCEGTAFVEVTVYVPQVYGLWLFGAQAVDEAGNPQDGALTELTELVYGTDPAPLQSFAYDSYDGETDQVTFAFQLNTETGA